VNRNNGIVLILIVFSNVFVTWAYPATIQRIFSENSQMVVVWDGPRPVRGSVWCLERSDKSSSCGRVKRTAKKRVTLEMQSWGNRRFVVGESVILSSQGKSVKNESNRAAPPKTPPVVGKKTVTQSVAEETVVTEVPTVKASTSHASFHSQGSSSPDLRLFFDLLLRHRPGLSPSLSFDTFHHLIWLEYNPDESLRFFVEINPNPRLYQISYQVLPRVQLQLGRIWVPFDQVSGHTFYGGVANVVSLNQPGTSVFLPDIWTDLGVAARFYLYEEENTEIDGYLYAVNGFQDGGVDPMSGSTNYPNFSGFNASDNNHDKALGARLHSRFLSTFGIGVSAYRGRYTNQANPSASLWMFGFDAQADWDQWQIRFGYIYMNVELLAPSVDENFIRGGWYAQLTKKYDDWRINATAGQSQNDHRLASASDRTLLGGSVFRRMGAWEFGLEFSRDLHDIEEKSNLTYAAFRVKTTM